MINPYLDLFNELSASVSPEVALRLRKKLIWAYSWAVPSREAIEALAALGPLVEIGAGTGYWAWLVQQAGGEINAFDAHPGQSPCWVTINKGDARVAREYPLATLFLCWPPLNESLAFDALNCFEGERVAYVGEIGGRTADEKFHDRLARDFTRELDIVLPCWPGFGDRLTTYRRNRF